MESHVLGYINHIKVIYIQKLLNSSSSVIRLLALNKQTFVQVSQRMAQLRFIVGSSRCAASVLRKYLQLLNFLTLKETFLVVHETEFISSWLQRRDTRAHALTSHKISAWQREPLDFIRCLQWDSHYRGFAMVGFAKYDYLTDWDPILLPNHFKYLRFD